MKILKIFLGLALLMPLAVRGQFTFVTNNGAITITGYTGSGAGTVIVPAYINNFPVTTIVKLWGASFTSLTISSNVVNISSNASIGSSSLTSITVDAKNPVFSSLNGVLFDKTQTTLLIYPMALTGSYSIPSTVTNIWQGAFINSSLSSISLPSSVTAIGAAPFFACQRLTAINVDAVNPAFSSLGGILFDKSQTTLIQYPGGLAGSYYIPNTVTSIADTAFAISKIAAVNIPDSVTNLGLDEFESCGSLSAINVDAQNSFYSSVNGVLFNKAQTVLLAYPGAISGSYTIPSSVTTIGNGAFAGCSRLSGVNLPDTLTTVSDWAFSGCSALSSSVIMPQSVASIGTNVFPLQVTRIFFKGDEPPSVGPSAFGSATTIYYLPGTAGWDSILDGRPTVLWNPQAQAADGVFVQTNLFGFTITGTTNIPIVVEASTNFSSAWTALQSVRLTNGVFYFTDPQWTNFPNRFYRIRSP